MAGIKTLTEFFEKIGKDKAKHALKKEVVITEKYDAFRFYVEREKNGKFIYYGKNSDRPLNNIDRTLTDIYESAILHFESLSSDLKKQIPSNHKFGLSWFPDRNKFLLSDVSIKSKDGKTFKAKNEKVLERWSSILKVDLAKEVFRGHLTESDFSAIVESSTEENFERLVENISLSLPSGTSALVFETSEGLFKIGKKPEASGKRGDLFDILLLDICEHLENTNVDRIKVSETRADDCYIEIISEIFNSYVNKKGQDYLSTTLDKPEFMQKAGRMNTAWLKNKMTRQIVESDSRYEYLFGVFLSHMRKPKNPSGLLSVPLVEKFNAKIERINQLSGDDYSFLEFSSLLKDESPTIDKDQANVTGTMIAQTFLGTDPPKRDAAEKINLIITLSDISSEFLVTYAENLKNTNGFRSIVINDNSLRGFNLLDRSEFGRMMGDMIDENREVFADYADLSGVPVLSEIEQFLSKSYDICTVSVERNTSSFQKEADFLVMQKGYTPIDVKVYKDPNRDTIMRSIEGGDINAFTKAAGKYLSPYWTSVKSSFDVNTYR
jgi:hypothetical protein